MLKFQTVRQAGLSIVIASVQVILFNYRDGLEEFCFDPVEAGDAVKGIY